ncbi:MAG TPA: DUF2147 domain-containing protein [Sphingomicrobium sp.]|nr:DUF2147 domain-containing protein [Sphingomicrobium sp.]
MFEIIAAIALAAAETASPASIEGRWVNPSKSVIIDIAPCGGAMCGTVAWANAQARQDAKKGTPELIGTQLLKDLQAKGAIWEGKLFVPDQGLHVEAKLQPEGNGELKVSGCEIGICKSQVWARAEGALPGVN